MLKQKSVYLKLCFLSGIFYLVAFRSRQLPVLKLYRLLFMSRATQISISPVLGLNMDWELRELPLKANLVMIPRFSVDAGLRAQAGAS